VREIVELSRRPPEPRKRKQKPDSDNEDAFAPGLSSDDEDDE
jgi:hypothetical protein